MRVSEYYNLGRTQPSLSFVDAIFHQGVVIRQIADRINAQLQRELTARYGKAFSVTISGSRSKRSREVVAVGTV